MVNKRGQGMSTNTIVLLIIAVIVLVVLILGFTIGWSKITPWISTNNVKDIVGACAAGCATGGLYDFCSVDRALVDDTKNKFTTSCGVLSIVDEFEKYDIGECSLDCSEACAEISINGNNGIIPAAAAVPTVGTFYNVSALAEEDNCIVLK